MIRYFKTKREEKRRKKEKEEQSARIARAKEHLRKAGYTYEWFIRQDPLTQRRVILHIACGGKA